MKKIGLIKNKENNAQQNSVDDEPKIIFGYACRWVNWQLRNCVFPLIPS